jgi:hypothetical protein
MTGRTHDLAAFTLLNVVFVTMPIPTMTVSTAVAALGGCFIGGLFPDIDQPTADLYRRFPAGSIFGRIIAPILGSHRMIGFLSHIIMDMFTREGVPLFFPIPWKFGIPPIAKLRMKTGSLLEKGIVFPGLMIVNGYLVYHFYPTYLSFFKQYIH